MISRPAVSPLPVPTPQTKGNDPLIDALTERANLARVMQKYGQMPVRQRPTAPPIQWEGDPNG